MKFWSWFRRHREVVPEQTETDEQSCPRRELLEAERETRRIEQQLRALEFQQQFERHRPS